MNFTPSLNDGKGERNASYIQKYLFATNKTYLFVFNVPKSIRKHLDLHKQISLSGGCTGIKIPGLVSGHKAT